MPRGIDEEIGLELIELGARFKGAIIGNMIRCFTEFTAIRLFCVEPGQKAVFVNMANGAAAFARAQKGIFLIRIEADAAAHGCIWLSRMLSQILPT